LTCSNMSDVYPTTNSEAMVKGRLQEEGNQFKRKCQSIAPNKAITLPIQDLIFIR
jgi:hypothetical protein